MEDGSFITEKADIIEQDILPEYQFAIHKHTHENGIYFITEVNTGASAFCYLGQKGDTIKLFLSALFHYKEQYKKAIVALSEKLGVKATIQQSLF